MVLNEIIKKTPDVNLYGAFEEKIFDLINEYFIGAMSRHADPQSTVRQFIEQHLSYFNKNWFDMKVRDTGRLRQRSKSIFLETLCGKRYDSLVKIATGYSVKYGHRLNFSKDVFKKAVSAQCAMQFARYGNVYTFEVFAFSMEILLKYFKIYELGPNGYMWLFDADSLSDCLNTILDYDDVNWNSYMDFLETQDIMAEVRRQAVMQPIKKIKPNNREDILKIVDYSLTKKENLERIKEAFGYSSINYVYKKLENFNIDKDTLQPINNKNYEHQLVALKANIEYERSAKMKLEEEKKKLEEEVELLKKILKINNIRL